MRLLADVEDRRSILRVLLVITILSVLFFSIFNWIVGLKLFALLEFAVACLWVGILKISKTTPNLQKWSLVYLATFFSLLLVGVLVSRFQAGLYSWIFIFPILSYLLLGRRLGFVLTAFGVFIGLGALGWRVWQQDVDVHWIIMGNFGLCALAIWVMAHMYEFKREKMVIRLHEMATKDPLTGLLNRHSMMETLSNVLYEARLRKEPTTFVYIDIDDFKLINDTYGHNHGDHILINVAHSIKCGTRQEDYVFRPGGDEFFIVFTNCTEFQAKEIFTQRIASQIYNLEENLSLSVGYFQADPDDEHLPEEMIQQADQSMYTVKRAGKLKNRT